MAKRKQAKKKPTEFYVDCACRQKARVFQLERGFMAHCLHCGAVTFFDNPQLLERLRLGGKLCHHHIEPRTCRGGHTTRCPICRVMAFVYDRQKGI